MKKNLTRLGPFAAAAGLLLSGCGGSEGGSAEGTTTTSAQGATLVKAGLRQPAGCFLTVFLEESVTPAQTRRVRSLMLSSKRVLTVSFVSKELSMKRLAAIRPDYARTVRVNPYPDRFEIVPRARIDVFAIILDFAAGVDGVTNVRAHPRCSSAA